MEPNDDDRARLDAAAIAADEAATAAHQAADAADAAEQPDVWAALRLAEAAIWRAKAALLLTISATSQAAGDPRDADAAAFEAESMEFNARAAEDGA